MRKLDPNDEGMYSKKYFNNACENYKKTKFGAANSSIVHGTCLRSVVVETHCLSHNILSRNSFLATWDC